MHQVRGQIKYSISLPSEYICGLGLCNFVSFKKIGTGCGKGFPILKRVAVENKMNIIDWNLYLSYLRTL